MKYTHIRLNNTTGRWSEVQRAWDDRGEFILLRKDGGKSLGGLVYRVIGEDLEYVCAASGDLESALREHFGHISDDAEDSRELAIHELDKDFTALLSGMDNLVVELPALRPVRRALNEAYSLFISKVCKIIGETI